VGLILLWRSVGRGGLWHHRGIQHSLRRVVTGDDAIAINHAVVADYIAPIPGWQTESDYRRGKAHFARTPMFSSIDGVGQSILQTRPAHLVIGEFDLRTPPRQLGDHALPGLAPVGGSIQSRAHGITGILVEEKYGVYSLIVRFPPGQPTHSRLLHRPRFFR
jgi:hypothetical protein